MPVFLSSVLCPLSLFFAAETRAMASLGARARLDEGRNWCRPLPAGEVRIGRVAANSDWVVDWDSKLSGLSGYHAVLQWRDGRLFVRRRTTPSKTQNAIFYKGQPADEFDIGP